MTPHECENGIDRTEDIFDLAASDRFDEGLALLRSRHWPCSRVQRRRSIGFFALARLVGIAGAERRDGADVLAPFRGLGEALLLRRRQLRQRVDLAAPVK